MLTGITRDVRHSIVRAPGMGTIGLYPSRCSAREAPVQASRRYPTCTCMDGRLQDAQLAGGSYGKHLQPGVPLPCVHEQIQSCRASLGSTHALRNTTVEAYLWRWDEGAACLTDPPVHVQVAGPAQHARMQSWRSTAHALQDARFTASCVCAHGMQGPAHCGRGRCMRQLASSPST